MHDHCTQHLNGATYSICFGGMRHQTRRVEQSSSHAFAIWRRLDGFGGDEPMQRKALTGKHITTW